jgi:hypothetical protein
MFKSIAIIAALSFASAAVVSGNAAAADKEPPEVLVITPVGPGMQLSRLFNDHRVLQRVMPVKIWGWASSNESCAVPHPPSACSSRSEPTGSWTQPPSTNSAPP